MVEASGNGASPGRAPEFVVVHTSDLHLGIDHRREELGSLDAVVRAVAELHADLLLLAGDVFDHNRLPLSLVDAAGRRLDGLGTRVVILPGNHDCLAPNSVYRRGGLGDVPNVEVLGITAGEALLLDDLDLEIWGKAHPDHVNMSPLEGGARPRRRRHHISLAHGHWVTGAHDHHRSWLIHDEEIESLDTDYLALGHWDRATPAGNGRVRAYYSGSPDLARSVNVVRFRSDAGIEVERHPLHAEAAEGATRR